MPCNNPLEKCCEVTPSACVQWTGSLGADSRTIADCETSLNRIIEQIDANLTLVINHVEIKIADLRAADVCEKIYSHIDDLKVKSTDGFVYSDKVVLELVKIVCDLQAQISIIHNNTKLQDTFFDLELPDTMQQAFSCLICDEGCDATRPVTFRDLLTILAGKIRDYEVKNAQLGCTDCGCPNC